MKECFTTATLLLAALAPGGDKITIKWDASPDVNLKYYYIYRMPQR